MSLFLPVVVLFLFFLTSGLIVIPWKVGAHTAFRAATASALTWNKGKCFKIYASSFCGQKYRGHGEGFLGKSYDEMDSRTLA